MSALPFPPYLANLLDRAASHLQAQGVQQTVEFDWLHEAGASRYTARFAWSIDDPAPRILVFRHLTGDFVCRSLPGSVTELDQACWNLEESGPDELDLHMKQAARGARRGGSGAA